MILVKMKQLTILVKMQQVLMIQLTILVEDIVKSELELIVVEVMAEEMVKAMAEVMTEVMAVVMAEVMAEAMSEMMSRLMNRPCSLFIAGSPQGTLWTASLVAG